MKKIKRYGEMGIKLRALFLIGVCISCLLAGEICFAYSPKRMLVSPINIGSVQTSYGVYPNTVDLIANEVINSLNKYSSYSVPDIRTAERLIAKNSLNNDYKRFLIDYRDNRIIDASVCTRLNTKLGMEKILLITSDYDIQSAFLTKSNYSKTSAFSKALLPLKLAFSKDFVSMAIPTYIANNLYESMTEESPINPYYILNIHLSLVDASTGLIVWEKSYKEKLLSSEFTNKVNSFSENVLPAEKLKKLAEKIADESTYEIYNASLNSNYWASKNMITSYYPKYIPTEGNLTMEGQSSPKSLENKRKQSYKNWVKEKSKTAK